MRNSIIVGVHRGLTSVEPLDIKQMVGRAGRVGLDERGDAFILLPQKEQQYWKNWCEEIPPITSTMNDSGILAFHIISEIEQGEIYNIETLMEWYNRSLAAFQNDFLDRVDAENLLEKLEKMKVIEQINGRYRETNLGKVAAYLYYSPYTISGWYFNFNKIINGNILDDISISWALANIQENFENFIPKNYSDQVNDFKYECRKRGLNVEDGPAVIGTYFYACLNFDDDISDIQKRSVKYDIERIVSALAMIDSRYANWKMNKFWKQLELRIQYEVTAEQVELCMLKGIGGKFVRKLFDAGIKTIKDFKSAGFVAENILGSKIYNKVLKNNF